MELRSFVFLLILIAVHPAVAASKPYCERTMRDFQESAYDPELRIAFENQGGLINGGVCWWHSKLQRYALYLAQYSPDLPRPDAKQARHLVRKLTEGKSVVVIPGYSGFRAFTADFPEVVQSELERWQKREGMVDFAWIRGLKDRPRHDPVKLERFMRKLFHRVTIDSEIVFLKLQLKGVPAHAWLLIGMEQLEDGFLLRAIDSNWPGQTLEYRYRVGDSVLNAGFGEMGVFEEYSGGLRKARRAFSDACGNVPRF